MTQTSSHPGPTARPRALGFQGTDLALIAVFAALMAVLSVIPPLFVVAAVPFALQMIAVMLTPLVIGPARATAALGLYVVVGLLGLPVFSGQSSGPGVLLGATGGFLVGYVVAAPVAGLVADAVLRRRPRKSLLGIQLYLAVLADMVVVYAFGIAGMMINASLSLPAALAANGLFMVGDLVKGVLAVAIAVAVLTAFPRLMPAAGRAGDR